jgi:purine-nucleoside phosphorylase
MLDKFGIKGLNRGSIYSAAGNDHLTVIHTHVSAPLTGDAVLYLKETPCEVLFLFGSCGLINNGTDDLSIGSLVTPDESVAMESFSALLNTNLDTDETFLKSRPDNDLIKHLNAINGNLLPALKCATMGSVLLEKKFHNFFINNKIKLADMESASFFAAANHIKKPAAALFFISDIIGKENYPALTPFENMEILLPAMEKGINIINTKEYQGFKPA